VNSPTAPLLPAQQAALTHAIDAALPQTQCTRCGYPDCRSYARAIAEGSAAINQCPPGGQEGIERLSRITGHPALPLNPRHGQEAPRHVAVIDENWCIGCTLCIQACPVDSIVGASKLMHTVIGPTCTGCELCIPVCPVDCISLQPVSGDRTGWQAWSPQQATQARDRFDWHQHRTQRAQQENEAKLAATAATKLANLAEHSKLDAEALERKRKIIEAAMARGKGRHGPDLP
jgi:electron transport complex protein RnfB